MISPRFSKWLSEGYKAKPGSQQMFALTTRLVRNVMQERKKIYNERMKRQREDIMSRIDIGSMFPGGM